MLDQFIADMNGKPGIGDTPENMGQCVGLVERWFDTLSLPHLWGNACDMPANADRARFDVVSNSSTYVPPVGAAVCYPAGWGGSPVGHTAIVAKGTTVNRLQIFEQNDRIGGGNGNCRLYSFPYNQYLTPAQIAAGWPKFIVPKNLNQGEPMIADTQNEFWRWNKLFVQIRGRSASHDEFVAAAVGQTWLHAMEILSDDAEADAATNAQNIGQVAVRDNWEGQIHTLQQQAADAQTQVQAQAASIATLDAKIADLESQLQTISTIPPTPTPDPTNPIEETPSVSEVTPPTPEPVSTPVTFFNSTLGRTLLTVAVSILGVIAVSLQSFSSQNVALAGAVSVIVTVVLALRDLLNRDIANLPSK